MEKIKLTNEETRMLNDIETEIYRGIKICSWILVLELFIMGLMFAIGLENVSNLLIILTGINIVWNSLSIIYQDIKGRKSIKEFYDYVKKSRELEHKK